MTYGWQLTQEYLKLVLSYDPLTGVFKWIRKTTPTANAIIIGSVAGSVRQHGYISIRINKHQYYAHRLAWFYVYGEWPPKQLDHINHNGRDNRISNLRQATDHINARNKSLLSNNKSGLHGVYWSKRDNNWRAQKKINGKTVYLGSDKSLFEVACIRLSWQAKAGYHKNHGAKGNG